MEPYHFSIGINSITLLEVTRQTIEVKTVLHPKRNENELALIDSRAGGNFIEEETVNKLQIVKTELHRLITVRNVDGSQNHDGCSINTNLTDSVTEDEPNKAYGLLPEDITYSEFLRYCSDSERRADLFEEIKDRGASQTIPTLLELFHKTFKWKKNSTKTRFATVISHNWTSRLIEDVKQYAALSFHSRNNELPAVLSGFANHANGTRAILAENDHRHL